jgi:recombinational DNA repair ATPase RecF
MAITKLKLEHITAFKKLDLDFSPGINVFIGKNGTGKTHVMKIVYSACDISKTGKNLADKIVNVFLPSDRAIVRLVKRQKGSRRGAV